MNRAYSVLEVRGIQDDQRIIEGIASTPTADRLGDIVESMGAKYSIPMPLLWQHKHDQPVGNVEFARPTNDGIPFKARIARIDEPGELQNRTDRAWQSVRNNLVRAVSIGFRPIEHEVMKDGGYRFKSWEWLELSLVTVPAQAEATITNIRSLDREQLAASGRSPDDTTPPGVSGPKQPIVVKAQEARQVKKTIPEQIAAFEATRAAKSARMSEIMEKASDEGVTLDAAQTEEYDTLGTEVKSVDEHLVRLRDFEQVNKAAAKPVDGATDTKQASDVRGGVVTSVKLNLPKGTAFTRYAMALMRSQGNLMQAVEISKQWHDTTPEVETVLRAAVAAGTTTDAAWAGPLVQYTNMAAEFVGLLRPQTILGRLNGLRTVPFNVRIPSQTGGSTAYWVGEGAPKPISALSFATTTMGFAKVADVVVMTNELVRFSSPSAEQLVRDDLTAQIAQFLDIAFIDPTKAAVAGVSPASVTNGLTAVTPTGTTAAALRTDIQTIWAQFITANLNPAGATWVMQPTMALSLSLMLNALGQPEFPNVNMNGGTLNGVEVVTSANVPAGVMVLLLPSEIFVADDGNVVIDASQEASLQMNSTPDNPTTATTVMVSLWQNNMTALRAERYINWQRRRAQAVSLISGAAYAA
jgi:HK97 family phage major capsid protein/HK97 family phage prohead protease